MLEMALFALAVLAITKPLGLYMYRVFEQTPPLPRLEQAVLRACGVDASHQHTWREYAAALLAFSAVGVVALMLLQIAVDGVQPWLALNTATSFVTNTNWQAYAGETTLSYPVQMIGLTTQNFVSAAAGMGVALALARGMSGSSLGNFWVDLARATLYVLLPISVVYALFLISQGVIQNLTAHMELTNVEGLKQTLPLGPIASQEAIKMLGTNGGGYFNANSAHPFENPTPLSNFAQMVSIFAIPAALTHTYGRMVKNAREGWAIFAAMGALFVAGAGATYWAETHDNASVAGLAVAAGAGNLEGKETRFGIASSALFATVTTDASCGAVNAMHDSFTPLGGLVTLANIQLGEVVFGGVGAGLYGILVMVLLSVFIAGLMVGRTPEYLGKKVESREIQLAMVYALIFPTVILFFTAVASRVGLDSLNNDGAHGLSEILYAYSSGAGNNGSAFAGLNANTPFYNISIALAMLLGRFGMIVPVLAIAGAMAGKRVVPAGAGTFPTDGALFSFLLVSVIIILGALTFFPALALAPISEHFMVTP